MTYNMSVELARTANAFLEKAANDKKSLSPMKLIKLCYIAQGSSLAEFDTALFPDEIQAWKYGPVIPSLYSEINEYGNSKITKYCCPVFIAIDECKPEKLTKQQNEIIDFIWKQLSNWTATELSTWTHRKNSAWYKVTEGGKKISNSEISLEEIKNEFKLLKEPSR